MQEIITITCPYCGAPTDVHVESVDDTFIEDCTVCCRPIELSVQADPDGATSVRARRGDD